ncbi:DUF4917 family protein [Pseudoalteromonas lipolytica]|uniref:DUF4917 family protein n=1 Tax=Pseudoalteromonas lipolytica TaxID=570156 RepID=UPI0030A23344
MPLPTFEESINMLPDGEVPSILVANGFSRAWRNEIFNYENLFDEADFRERDRQLRSIFNRFNTFDFEKVMLVLKSAQKVCEIYEVDNEILQQITLDQEQLKESLIQVIANTHPRRPSEITDQSFISTRRFIARFSNVFSLNYDMLLYWAVNKNNLAPAQPDSWCGKKDGFYQDEWQHRCQNLHFLHGSLHLYNNAADVNKRVYNNEDWDAIVDQVRRWLDEGYFPLFVSEPTSNKKLEKIKHNPYLNACFEALKEQKGSFFIHGHSISESDMHIFDQINKSEISRVFISVYGDENSISNRELIANARRFLIHNIEICFYDATTTPIWL